MKRRTYGYNRVQLYEHYTADELAAMGVALRADPANRNPEPGSVELYTAQTRRRLANIAYAIYYHQQDRRRECVDVTGAVITAGEIVEHCAAAGLELTT